MTNILINTQNGLIRTTFVFTNFLYIREEELFEYAEAQKKRTGNFTLPKRADQK